MYGLAMRLLLIATHNSHKTAEIRAMLGGHFDVRDLNAHPEIPAAQETGDTFEANAIIKALEAARIFPGLVLSDDSGLEVDAIGGAPGVHSARYAGERASDAENRAKLLATLKSLPPCHHSHAARFRCVMALAEDGKILGTFEGSVEGELILEERGESGFGYDTLFIPAGEQETFAQLRSEIKNQLSHRAFALAKLRSFLL